MNQIQLHIPAMKCGGCATSITNVIQTLDQTAHFHADPATKLVKIQSEFDAMAIIAALSKAGFPADIKPA